LRLSVPALAKLTDKVAVPSLRAELPSEAVPFRKETEPEAVLGLTVALSVTLASTAADVGEAARLVLVAVVELVSLLVCEVELLLPPQPAKVAAAVRPIMRRAARRSRAGSHSFGSTSVDLSEIRRRKYLVPFMIGPLTKRYLSTWTPKPAR
jgi:hypothetical protein